MEPIFDRTGNAVGWLRGNIIYGPSGNARAFIHRENVINYRGYQLGRLNRGIYRDLSGNAIAFHRGGRGGPLLPITGIPPIPPIPSIPPIPPIPPIPAIPAIPTLSWSAQNWEQWLA